MVLTIYILSLYFKYVQTLHLGHFLASFGVFLNCKRYPHEIWTNIEHIVIHKPNKDTTISFSEKKIVECHFFQSPFCQL